MIVLSHLSHVQNGISHSAKCGVDTDICHAGNFFETHFLKVAHLQHFPLVVGQSHNQTVNVGFDLRRNQVILHSGFAQLFTVENIYFAGIGGLQVFRLLFSEMVEYEMWAIRVIHAENRPFSTYRFCFIVIIALTNVSWKMSSANSGFLTKCKIYE